MKRIADAQLYLLFTPSLCAEDPWHCLRAALRGGVDLVQWRSPYDETGLRRCLEICSAAEVGVVVNDHVQLAIESEAIGAHVGQDDLPAAEARALLGPGRALGVSTHDLEQIRAALCDGADHLGFGPVFPTATKGYSEGLGPAAVAQALAATELPVFPIGGIGPENLPTLVAAGAHRAAVSSAILQAPDPERAAATLRDLLA